MLYIVATPIGNLSDITERALKTLQEVNVVLCEDTRVTQRLLRHYSLSDKKLISYHHHSIPKKTQEVINLISEQDVALVTDAGTPGISDPGNKLIQELLKIKKTKIIPVPGPSAITTALSISGFPTDKFIFKGFVPHKKGREKFLKEILAAKETVVFYESPYRIIKCLEQLINLNCGKQLVICRELTKKFETIYRGFTSDILNQIKKDFPTGKPKGEFVIITN